MKISDSLITAIDFYAPEKILSNYDLEKMVDTSDEWIKQRTGIEKRHVAADGEFASHMAHEAVQKLLKKNKKALEGVDFILCSTFTPDYLTPSVAGIIHGTLELGPDVGVLDINAACAGFVQGLLLGHSMLQTGLVKKILFVSTEAMSKITDYTDRNTCVLFGDGATAVILEKSAEDSILAVKYGANGAQGHRLFCTNLDTRFVEEGVNKKEYVWQDGRGVYNFVIKTVPAGIASLLKDAGKTIDDIDWFIPHSANLRMIQFLSKQIGISMDKTLTSIEEFGNTSSATIPLALALADKEGNLKKGDTLLVYGFGGGLNHAGAIFKW